MRKLRSDSSWNELSPEQWETLEGWLLDENISYREAQERISKEWNLTRSMTSVIRFRKYCAKKRNLEGMPETMRTAKKIKNSGADLEELRDSTRCVLSKRYFEQAASGENLNELEVLGRLLCQGEEREIRRRRLELSRERWEFRISKEALKLLPMLNEFTKQKEEQERARIARIKHMLFGDKPDHVAK